MVSEPDATAAVHDRVLWRMQGPARVIVAVLVQTEAGTELRIAFEGDDAAELLSQQWERRSYRVVRLIKRAERLRAALREQGWTDLAVPGQSDARENGRAVAGTALGLGLVTAVAWWWRKQRTTTPTSGEPD